jgi:hypothetical protein
MIWQDIILGLGSIVFCLALIPTIFSKNKPSLWTSVPTCMTLFAFVIVYYSLDLYFAVATTFASATLWDIIALQTIYLKEIEGENANEL